MTRKFANTFKKKKKKTPAKGWARAFISSAWICCFGVEKGYYHNTYKKWFVVHRSCDLAQNLLHDADIYI